MTLSNVHRGTTGGNGSGGVVLGGEDVARGPGQLSAESLESLDEDGGLDGCRYMSVHHHC